MIKKVLLFIVLLNLYFLVNLQAQVNKVHNLLKTKELVCSDCHTCDNPTAENPCLRDCPRFWLGKSSGHKLTSKQGPDIVTLNELENLYEPVKFFHKLHADMADMSGGCVACHHYTPTDASHPPCKQCHSHDIIQENIRQPGLKGAYHRQCMGCHREWSDEAACEICHALKSRKQAEGEAYVAVHYRPCKEPEKKVYETSHSAGTYVTFFHNNHSKMYGLACSDCHKGSACISCHYQGEKPLSVVEANADLMHHKCSACHNISEKTGCKKCHSKTEKKGFDHAQATGWALNVYHQKLSCRSCHPAGKPIGKLDKTCNNCHSKWNSENFSHSIVGLALDETHSELDCSDCHKERRFDKKTDCSDCHEEETYPEYKPGKVTKKGR